MHSIIVFDRFNLKYTNLKVGQKGNVSKSISRTVHYTHRIRNRLVKLSFKKKLKKKITGRN